MLNAACQSRTLYMQDFLAATCQCLPFGNKRQRFHTPRQFKRNIRPIRLQFRNPARRECAQCSRQGESRVHPAFGSQAFHVDFAVNDLSFHGKPLRLGQHVAVLTDVSPSAEHQVLRTLAVAAPRIDITRQQTCALAFNQAAQVRSLPHQFVACTEVEDDVRAAHRQVTARRHRSPKILANLDAESAMRRAEQQICPERYRLAAQPDLPAILQHIPRSEPPLFVKLLIIGQMRFGNQPMDFTTLDDSRTVEKFVVSRHRNPDKCRDAQSEAELHQLQQRSLRLVQQELLLKQVLTSIGGHAKLGQTDDFSSLSVRHRHHVFNLLNVKRAVSNPHRGNAGRHFNKTVLHCVRAVSLSITLGISQPKGKIQKGLYR